MIYYIQTFLVNLQEHISVYQPNRDLRITFPCFLSGTYTTISINWFPFASCCPPIAILSWHELGIHWYLLCKWLSNIWQASTYKSSQVGTHFWAQLCKVHGGLVCITFFLSVVTPTPANIYSTITSHNAPMACYKNVTSLVLNMWTEYERCDIFVTCHRSIMTCNSGINVGWSWCDCKPETPVSFEFNPRAWPSNSSAIQILSHLDWTLVSFGLNCNRSWPNMVKISYCNYHG